MLWVMAVFYYHSVAFLPVTYASEADCNSAATTLTKLWEERRTSTGASVYGYARATCFPVRVSK